MKLDYPIRLQSFLAKSGFGSRRFCETLITDKRVRVNGKTVTELGTKVEENDVVYVDDILAEPADAFYYYALNKPRGWVCTNYDPKETNFARDLIDVPHKDLLFHIGRLDKDSKGLILFTNDGDFANKVMHPSNEVEKEYYVKTDRQVQKSDMEKALAGKVYPYTIKDYKLFQGKWFSITLTEGKNREIRKLMDALGYEVVELIRMRIAGVELGKLQEGRYRMLNKAEIQSLNGGNE